MNSYRLQGIKETHAVELVFANLAFSVFAPELHILLFIKGVKMVERIEETVKMICAIYFFESVARVLGKSPDGVVQIKKYVFISHVNNE